MNHKNKRPKRKPKVIRVWTYPQAQGALPYITSVMRSLREHWLEAKTQEARGRRLAGRSGRPDRRAILDQEEAAKEGERARERFHEAFEELQKIEVFCIDPNQGLSVLPVVHDDKLAWLIYDLYDGNTFQSWRYHEDPIDLRRPIKDMTADSGEKTMTA
jgi:hypothetical protein